MIMQISKWIEELKICNIDVCDDSILLSLKNKRTGKKKLMVVNKIDWGKIYQAYEREKKDKAIQSLLSEK